MLKEKKRTYLLLLFAAILIAAGVFCFFIAKSAEDTGGGSPGSGERHIVILGTSDMHSNIWGYDYEKDEETTNNGMARVYSYIQQVREEEPVVFVVDGGDEIEGTILSNAIYNRIPDEPHPVMAAMNAMGYDSMTLGNHEFDWGVPAMLKILSGADFPVLGANILDRNGDYLTGSGWTIIERGGVRLAVIGVCTPDIPYWDGGKEGIDELTYESASAGVKRAVREIGDQADLIMVSAHMGQHAEYDQENGADSANQILEDNPEVDLLQVGHAHITVNDREKGVPVAGVRNSGREVARYDVTLDEQNHVQDCSVQIVDMEGVEPSEELRSLPLIREAHERALSFAKNGAETDDEDGVEGIGKATAKFQPENEISGIPEGRLRDTPAVDLINQIQLEESGADVSSAQLFNDTGDLPEGTIAYRDVSSLYPYENILYRVPVTGAELKAYMEWSAGYYNQWKEGDINISSDPDWPGYKYDMFAGVDYEIDISRPAGERIRNVIFRGEPLRDDQKLTLAINHYRYSSVLKALKLAAGEVEWESPRPISDLLADYVREHSPLEPRTDNNWKITGIDLQEDDPRRAELIDWINHELLPVPANASYNLQDYDRLREQAIGGQ